ncbi:MAG TPA: hypothetical protein ENJ18_02900 [Nannocystis exedens]|nr:hypothetical protein [Nannocystis exedens]
MPSLVVSRCPLRKIGVDETSFQKGHEYVSVVYDTERARVLEVMDGQTASMDTGVPLYTGIPVKRSRCSSVCRLFTLTPGY